MVCWCLGYAMVLGAERTSCTASQPPEAEGGYSIRCSQRCAKTWEGTSPLATKRRGGEEERRRVEERRRGEEEKEEERTFSVRHMKDDTLRNKITSR